MARGIVLPGDRRPMTGKLQRNGLIVPSRIAEEENPVLLCRVCGKKEWTIHEIRGWQNHVVRCAADHEGELHELSLRTRDGGETMHGDQNWEADREQWAREHAEELIEGRKTLYGKDDPWRRRG